MLVYSGGTNFRDTVVMTSGQSHRKSQQLLRVKSIMHVPVLLNSVRVSSLLLLLLLRPFQVGAFMSTTTTTGRSILVLRGGSSAEESTKAAAEAAEAAAVPTAEIMIGRGPQEPVRPFVPDLLLGRKALVTGGNRGIGEAITVALVKAGAQVCVMANSEE